MTDQGKKDVKPEKEEEVDQEKKDVDQEKKDVNQEKKDVDEEKKDVIQSLVTNPFKTRPEAERKEILKARRPQPLLKSCENNQGTGRPMPPFEEAWYVTYEWLTGSTTNNRLYCWPCLLLASNRKRIWTKEGYYDFRILRATAESHALSKDHVKNSGELAVLDPLNSTVKPSKSVAGVDVKNAYYKYNCLLLERLIRVTTTLCKEGLAIYLLEKDNERGDNFKQLFDLIITDEKDLKAHCEKLGPIYKNMFTSILKDVIETISHEILYHQKAELKKAPFFSVQVDNGVDVSGEFFHTVIVRYVDESGDVQEHFLGFPLVCSERDRQFAAGLFGTIEAVLGFNSYKEKMISFSLCGSSIQVNQLELLKKKIVSKAPEAMLIHSVAHRHKVVLQQGITFVTSTQAFFAVIESLIGDFKRTENGDFFLSHFLEDTTPSHTPELHWCLSSKSMAFLLSERGSLIGLFESRCNDPYMSQSIIIESHQYMKNLLDHDFVFLLLGFQAIFKITDEFFNVLQKRSADVSACHTSLEQTLQKLETLKKSNDTIKAIFDKSLGLIFKSIIYSNEMFTRCLHLFQSVVANICDQLKIRYADLRKWEFLQLTDSKKFATYKSKFPTEALESLTRAYGKHFKIPQLKDELSLFIYPDVQFRLSPPAVLKQLIKADLREIVPESYKLFSLVATLPITPVSGESCFQRLNTYLKNNKTMGTFTARIPISILLVQMPLLRRLEKSDSWHQKIMKRFADEKKKHNIQIVP